MSLPTPTSNPLILRNICTHHGNHGIQGAGSPVLTTRCTSPRNASKGKDLIKKSSFGFPYIDDMKRLSSGNTGEYLYELQREQRTAYDQSESQRLHRETRHARLIFYLSVVALLVSAGGFISPIVDRVGWLLCLY